jgi:hypothetical protein
MAKHGAANVFAHAPFLLLRSSADPYLRIVEHISRHVLVGGVLPVISFVHY